MGLFSGSWEQNPYAKQLWAQLFNQYQSGAIPEGILSPIREAGEQERAGIEKQFANVPYGNLTGLMGAQKMKSFASTKRAIGTAGANWKARLMQMLLGLSGQAQYKPAQLGAKDILDILI